jgi:peptidoglycan/xylan/chitin deacetylase (PgdA/CDA1 family)
MTVSQIRELIASGFDLAAHSTTHPYCSKIDYEQFEEEVISSIKGIESKFGTKVTLFSYPFGSRANRKNEEKLINMHGDKVHGLLGIKNDLRNKNPLKWERDLQEASLNISAFRFFVLPLIRKLGL